MRLMNTHIHAANDLYALAQKSIGALPTGAQASASAQLAGLRATTQQVGAAVERVAQSAATHAAARPVADARLNHAMATKIMGMKPTTAIIGAAVAGSLVIGTTAWLHHRRDQAQSGQWTQRIDRERASVQGRPR